MQTAQRTGNRMYKDRLFRLLFSEKTQLLELYNALNQSSYTRAEDLEIVTLEDVLYMKMKNDVAFVLEESLNLYEHQSTYNPNMPLRGLFYFAEIYRQLAGDRHLYSSRLISLPTPVYVVFYNGGLEVGEEETLRLSDAYSGKDTKSCLELTARILNINCGCNRELMEHCQTLGEYACFVGKVKEYAKEGDLTRAIDRAIDECIQENILRNFLIKRRSEVMNTLLTEYDEERVLKDLSQEFYEDGFQAGQETGHSIGLAEGRAEGKQEISRLLKRLLEENRLEEARRAVSDEAFQQQLLRELQTKK